MRRRLAVLATTLSALFLVPSVVLAADYTVSDDASCTAFLAAIGATGFADANQCYIESGTLGAADTLTVTNDYAIRPQFTSDPDAVVFSNQGTINIDSDGPSGSGGYYGAGHFVNAGIFNVSGTVNHLNTLDNTGAINIAIGGEYFNNGVTNNSGTITYAGTINNNGVINNACGATITGTGTYTGPAPVQAACPPSPVASLNDAATPAPSPTAPLATLGFGLLLVGSLGALAYANTRTRR
jgi:hypothetical protein